MRLFLPLILFFCSSHLFSQNIDSSLQSLEQLPDKYYAKVDKKISAIESLLTKKSVKYLEKMQRTELKLQRKLEKINPETTKLFAGTKEKYSVLLQSVKSNTAPLNKVMTGEYNSYLDTLSTSLSFLKQISVTADKVKGPLSDLQQLQSKLQQADKIKQFIAERRQAIKEMLSKFTKVPAGLKKEYDQLSKTAYYYSAQVKEYKEMLKDPAKIEKKALSLLNKLPAFQKFMKENSQLASLFRLPSDYGSSGSQSITGLQTRASVQSLIQQQISIGGPNAQAQIQQNLAQAHAEMNKLKDKINQLGGGNSDLTIPDFKPNSQKTKSFLKRLEYGIDVQFAKANGYLPTAANLGLSIGYKLNDKSVIGFGINYKMGIGSIQHIKFTHQGLGLRSYVDYKIKNQLYVSGGYEMNYNAEFKKIDQLKNYDAWQRSALVGISKKYKISKKVKGEMKLLYDFLAFEHVPKSQQIVFRLGYVLK